MGSEADVVVIRPPLTPPVREKDFENVEWGYEVDVGVMKFGFVTDAPLPLQPAREKVRRTPSERERPNAD